MDIIIIAPPETIAFCIYLFIRKASVNSFTMNINF